MMKRGLWSETADKLGFAGRHIELIDGGVPPTEVHAAIRDLVTRKKTLEGEGRGGAAIEAGRSWRKLASCVS